MQFQPLTKVLSWRRRKSLSRIEASDGQTLNTPATMSDNIPFENAAREEIPRSRISRPGLSLQAYTATWTTRLSEMAIITGIELCGYQSRLPKSPGTQVASLQLWLIRILGDKTCPQRKTGRFWSWQVGGPAGKFRNWYAASLSCQVKHFLAGNLKTLGNLTPLKVTFRLFSEH